MTRQIVALLGGVSCLLADALSECVVLRIAGRVGERQDRDRGRTGMDSQRFRGGRRG
jgi:hypothetical protein